MERDLPALVLFLVQLSDEHWFPTVRIVLNIIGSIGFAVSLFALLFNRLQLLIGIPLIAISGLIGPWSTMYIGMLYPITQCELERLHGATVDDLDDCHQVSGLNSTSLASPQAEEQLERIEEIESHPVWMIFVSAMTLWGFWLFTRRCRIVGRRRWRQHQRRSNRLSRS
jgi:hypothetical protein